MCNQDKEAYVINSLKLGTYFFMHVIFNEIKRKTVSTKCVFLLLHFNILQNSKETQMDIEKIIKFKKQNFMCITHCGIVYKNCYANDYFLLTQKI